MPEPLFVIKVCGITRQEDLTASLDAGANAVGFNFYRKSPRYLDPHVAGQLASPASCLRVGVFVDASQEELSRAVEEASLDVVQLHGHGCFVPSHGRVWRSLPAGSPTPAEDSRIEAYLLDTPTPQHGGSGQVFNWSLAREFPYRLIVAGGLDGNNVAAAITALHPWGVDACSRLESAPGRKDAARVKAFATAALQASEQLLKQEVTL